MTKLKAIRWFMEYVTGERIVIAREKFNCSNYAMDIYNECPRLKLPNSLDIAPDECDKIFRKDFVERCPMAKGFSNITITLLHEAGHWATRSLMNEAVYSKMAEQAESQEMYMKIPWEHLATEWAICWLHCPFNRKMAKLFEKDFFGY